MTKSASASPIPERTVERLCTYRHTLFRWRIQGKQRFYSRELAADAGITPAQVRRDMMSLQSEGSQRSGYATDDVIRELGLVIEGERGQRVVLVGAGNLGCAIAGYLDGIRPELRIVAVFDSDPAKICRTTEMVPCLPMADLERVVVEHGVLIGVLTVPSSVAQDMATRLAAAGVKAIVNFSPIKLKLPADVFVEDVDISRVIEKAAYFARISAMQGGAEAGRPNNLEGGVSPSAFAISSNVSA